MSAVLDKDTAYAALKWYVDNGVYDTLNDAPFAKINMPAPVAAPLNIAPTSNPTPNTAHTPPAPLGKQDAIVHAVAVAKACDTLPALREALCSFDGLSIRKTATNIVFADGQAGADVMVIGDAPNADEDRAGKPFAGQNGALLDKILACINLNRASDAPQTGVYLTNFINWRPPGARTPTPAELQISLPLLEKHIILAKPKLIMLCGTLVAQNLLGTKDSMSKLRGRFHDYTPQTAALSAQSPPPIPALVTYHPEQLLRTPLQKRGAWADILMIEEKLRNNA